MSQEHRRQARRDAKLLEAAGGKHQDYILERKYFIEHCLNTAQEPVAKRTYDDPRRYNFNTPWPKLAKEEDCHWMSSRRSALRDGLPESADIQ